MTSKRHLGRRRLADGLGRRRPFHWWRRRFLDRRRRRLLFGRRWRRRLFGHRPGRGLRQRSGVSAIHDHEQPRSKPSAVWQMHRGGTPGGHGAKPRGNLLSMATAAVSAWPRQSFGTVEFPMSLVGPTQQRLGVMPGLTDAAPSSSAQASWWAPPCGGWEPRS